MKHRTLLIVDIFIVALLLVAGCGGGGSDESQPDLSTYAIFGTVILEGGGLENVNVALSGAATPTTITDVSGNYLFNGLQNGAYVIKASKEGYTFSPNSKSVVINDSDSAANNFIASAVEDTASPVEDTASEVYVYNTQWGSSGGGTGEFNSPRGAAIDSVGDVYVADFLNWRVQKFTASGQFISVWGGTAGDDDGQFEGTYSIAIDDIDNVYVVDTSPRIQKFKPDGTFIMKWGSYGNGDGQFSS